MGTFITDGSAVLPGVKSDARPATIPVAADEWAAEDANDIRTALLDLRTEALSGGTAVAVEAAARAAADAAIIASGAMPANVGIAPVIATGSVTARTVADRFANVVWVTDFGATMDGATNDTAAVLAAITSAMLTGKEVRFPPGTCRCDGQLLIPNDGGATPRQRPLRIVGSGASMSGQGGAAYGGTILDLQYAGTGGKILTLGLGLVEISGVTFIDGSSGTTPFLWTTNTTLHIHDTAFIGSKSGTACDQDCIILGGTTATQVPATYDSPFQGYATVIHNNFFDRIRRAVYMRAWCNATVFRDNTIWASAGSNLAGGAAIELITAGANATVGNVIQGNLIECGNYPYAIKLGDSTYGNSIAWNNLYDPSATYLAAVRFESGSLYNLVIDGYRDDSKPGVSDANSIPKNTFITSHQSQTSIYPQPVSYQNNFTVDRSPGSTWLEMNDVTNNDNIDFRVSHGGGTVELLVYAKIAGVTNNPIVGLKTYGNAGFLNLYGGGAFTLQAVSDLTMRAAAGSTLWFGDGNARTLYWQESTKTLVFNDSSAKAQFGAGGPTITTGSAVPSAAEVDGSIYLRSGGANGTMYIRKGGVWKEVTAP